MMMRIRSFLPLTLLILSFASCSKEDNDSNRIIIDPPTYAYLTIWKEIESRTETTNWVTLSNGNTLTIFSNSTDYSIKPAVGQYIYKAVNSQINIDSIGFVQQTDSLFHFISIHYRDTTTLKYKIYGDSLLVINNSAVAPATEIKYRKYLK
jgi:hypothetical protein